MPEVSCESVFCLRTYSLSWAVCRCGNWGWLVGLQRNHLLGTKVMLMEESRVQYQKTRSSQTLLIGSFDLWEASGVQQFDAFVSRTEKQADGPGCRGCTTQKPPVDKRESTVFSFCPALFPVTFVLFSGRVLRFTHLLKRTQ